MGTHPNTMVQFTGKFTRVSAEGYDEFLKALNVSFLLRKAATASTPVMEITETDGNWSMKTSTTLKSMELKFKMGVPFDEETSDGRKCTTTVTMKGNQLFTEQKAKDKGVPDVTAVRTFEDDKLTMTSCPAEWLLKKRQNLFLLLLIVVFLKITCNK